MPDRVLVIACGALAREILALKRTRGWQHLTLRCLDPRLHNRPDRIPGAVRDAIARYRDEFARIFVAYADCGTGGRLDALLAEEGVERLPGAHCYQSYAGGPAFEALADAEPGTFYLTDFLARHFERLVIEPLGLDRHPELRDAYFGNYRRVVYLAQQADAGLAAQARAAAARLGLEFEQIETGFGELAVALERQVQIHGPQDRHLLA